jgi:hypothetical protein
MEHKRTALVCVRCVGSTRANRSQTYDRSPEGQMLKVDSSRDLGIEIPNRVIVCGLSEEFARRQIAARVRRKRQNRQHAGPQHGKWKRHFSRIGRNGPADFLRRKNYNAAC